MNTLRKSAASMGADNAPSGASGVRAAILALLGGVASGAAGRAERRRMLRFGGVGLVNTVADFAVFWALTALGAAPVAANGAGFVASNLQSYLLNSRITFRVDGRAAAISLIGYGKFLLAHTMSLVVSTLLIVALAERIGALPAKGAAIGVAFLWNYATSAAIVFARRGAATEGRP